MPLFHQTNISIKRTPVLSIVYPVCMHVDVFSNSVTKNIRIEVESE